MFGHTLFSGWDISVVSAGTSYTLHVYKGKAFFARNVDGIRPLTWETLDSLNDLLL